MVFFHSEPKKTEFERKIMLKQGKQCKTSSTHKNSPTGLLGIQTAHLFLYQADNLEISLQVFHISFKRVRVFVDQTIHKNSVKVTI